MDDRSALATDHTHGQAYALSATVILIASSRSADKPILPVSNVAPVSSSAKTQLILSGWASSHAGHLLQILCANVDQILSTLWTASFAHFAALCFDFSRFFLALEIQSTVNLATPEFSGLRGDSVFGQPPG